MKTLLVAIAAFFTPLGVVMSLGVAPAEQSAPKMPRDIYVVGSIDDSLASSIHFQLQMLNSESNEDITMHISSGGGSVYSGLRIYDDMMESPSRVNTICEGFCMSMAAILLAAGSHREASQNTVIMLHEVSFGAQGKLSEVKVQVGEANRLQTTIDAILMRHSGLTLEQVKQMESYDHFMSSQEAKSLGLIDVVREYKKK